MASCRRNKVKFGNVLPVFAQVALTRVLYRLHERGVIKDDEWEKRRKEPMHIAGPINIRPFLDQEWFKNGGASELCISLGFFFYTLPFLPLGLAATSDYSPRTGLEGGAPPFSDLLSHERFFWRSHILRKQSEAYLKHPLLVDINVALFPPRIEQTKKTFDKWCSIRDASENGNKMASVADGGTYLTPDLVFTHGGSSLGNVRIQPLIVTSLLTD